MPSHKPLAGRIPRGMRNHRSVAGRESSTYLRGLMERLGALPAGCAATLRQAGRLHVELLALEAEYDKAMAQRRLTVARRLRRSMTGSRVLLLRLEERLEHLAAMAEPAAFSTLRAVRRG